MNDETLIERIEASGGTMLAFNNDTGLKDFVLTQLALHREADKLVKGQYWHEGKGCAVGCTLEAVRLRRGKSADIDHARHALFEPELGIPQILARLEDRLFEQLPNEQSQRWPERFISAIRPGADLSMVWPRFALWLLADELLPRVDDKNSKTTAALAAVAGLYREWCDTGKSPDRRHWLTARDEARAAAAAAYAAAAAAAYACAAYAAAAADADAATDAYAYAAAWRRGYDADAVRQTDKLIDLLAAA